VRTKEVIKKSREAAESRGLEFEIFERTNHTGIRVGAKKSTLGRHTETANLAAQKLYKQFEDVLGEGWWK